jgi:hypothetical protein
MIAAKVSCDNSFPVIPYPMTHAREGDPKNPKNSGFHLCDVHLLFANVHLHVREL